MEGSVGDERGIKALDKNVVHRICTGQVILSLGAACKELIENSLDAGATSIEIRAKDYGVGMLEVVDNGKGIENQNFCTFGQAHCTSKLEDFNDLVNLETFGFRGEALNALMALSDVTIVTRHVHSQVGNKLEYDHQGKLTKNFACARQVGTTVSVTNFFEPLPVRRKEFEKNAKRDFTKLTSLVYAYCLVCTKVRFEFSHILNGKKTTIVTTYGNATIQENICNVFGSKQIERLLEFEKSEPTSEDCEYFKIMSNVSAVDCPFDIQGFVSGVQRTDGRCSADRQFLFINGRPCDFPKIFRVINEIYHEYNKQQYPTVILNIQFKSDAIDVNVTPDKRSIYVSNESFLLATLKSSLRIMFQKNAGTFDVVNSSTQLPSGSGNADESIQPVSKQAKISDTFRSFMARGTSGETRQLETLSESSSDGRVSVNSVVSNISDEAVKDGKVEQSFTLNFHKRNCNNDSFRVANDFPPLPAFDDSISPMKQSFVDECVEPSSAQKIRSSLEEDRRLEKVDHVVKMARKLDAAGNKGDLDKFIKKARIEDGFFRQDIEEPSTVTSRQRPKMVVEETVKGVLRKSRTVSFSMEALKRRLLELGLPDEEGLVEAECSEEAVRNFRAQITPSQNKSAEEELKRCISKEMFKSMEIIGQFNRGFIIVRSGDDLFIVDQHASDEKFNYESLQQSFVVESQRLIRPIPLKVTWANENLLIDNLEIFTKNGFEFEIANREECSNDGIEDSVEHEPRIKVTAVPNPQKDPHGKLQDIDDILFVLADFPGRMYRPSRFQTMFASKACRKSVMIGTSLSKEHMEKIVAHMADIDQPWNCPHGRPTMRHLFNLKLLPN